MNKNTQKKPEKINKLKVRSKFLQRFLHILIFVIALYFIALSAIFVGCCICEGPGTGCVEFMGTWEDVSTVKSIILFYIGLLMIVSNIVVMVVIKIFRHKNLKKIAKK